MNTALLPTHPLASTLTLTAPARPAVAELRRLLAVLDEALEMPPPERAAWLASLDDHQPELARRVFGLLHAEASTSGTELLERGAVRALGLDAGRPIEHATGDEVGPYRLLREIGHGGMGRVWLASRAQQTGEASAGPAATRPVALKLPLRSLQPEALRRRFQRERDILASLGHPHIARLVDAGFSGDGQPYLAMEYVEGLSVDLYCRRQRLPLAARLELVLQVLAAVQHAHERQVVHRDIKPSNVLVTRDGVAVLLDFGIARLVEAEAGEDVPDLTQEFGRVLSLHHAAPEQVAGEPTGPATDLWSIGVLLYELISGQRPFPGAGRAEIERAILHHAPPPPSARLDPAASLATRAAWRELDGIVLAALHKESGRRPRSAAALRLDLARWLRRAPWSAGACVPAPADGLAPA